LLYDRNSSLDPVLGFGNLVNLSILLADVVVILPPDTLLSAVHARGDNSPSYAAKSRQLDFGVKLLSHATHQQYFEVDRQSRYHHIAPFDFDTHSNANSQM